jgi:hypothetical protein
MVLALAGCGVDVGTPNNAGSDMSPAMATPTPEADASSPIGVACIPEDLIGSYNRTRGDADTPDTDLHGDWSLELTDCAYAIAVDGIEQGSGQLATVDDAGESIRLALSGDLGCPNEFTGEALYDFALTGTSLDISEAIAGTDQCEGRASAFAGSPPWSQ